MGCMAFIIQNERNTKKKITAMRYRVRISREPLLPTSLRDTGYWIRTEVVNTEIF